MVLHIRVPLRRADNAWLPRHGLRWRANRPLVGQVLQSDESGGQRQMLKPPVEDLLPALLALQNARPE